MISLFVESSHEAAEESRTRTSNVDNGQRPVLSKERGSTIARRPTKVVNGPCTVPAPIVPAPC
jgi:hypothetical protein